ncbi:hypothetical protein HPB47_008009 [Ixodes persulcatus]|uniref:Uncharacterized protein n=1 Tax=Ixodes persulcatus TaxID=34615 RepID=A0AC60P6A0_IXOPE|nr:hypothetical protein HPB47_008009 [Ixodes persulcatus]
MVSAHETSTSILAVYHLLRPLRPEELVGLHRNTLYRLFVVNSLRAAVERLELVLGPVASIKVVCVPGHAGVRGNKAAHRLTSVFSSLPSAGQPLQRPSGPPPPHPPFPGSDRTEARWHARLRDFKDKLTQHGVMKHVACLGLFKMSHVWMLTLKTPETKQRMVNISRLKPEYGHRPAFPAVAVTSKGQVKTCATIFTTSPEQAEETAIALALTATPCPKLAHSTVRGYTVLAGWTQSRDHGAHSACDRLVAFYDITSLYRLSRRLYPPGTQAPGRECYVAPAADTLLPQPSCPLPYLPISLRSHLHFLRERWDAALRSSDPTTQLQVVRRAAEVAEAHGLPVTRCG